MSTDTPAPAPLRDAARRVRLGFLVLLAAGLLGFALLPPAATRALGLSDNGAWFLDTFAILASNDALRAGQDPSQPNPLDVYGRPHSYSGWWFVLGRLGLTREDNVWLGLLTVGAFVVGTALVLKPATAAEAAGALLAVFAPGVLLAVNRANNDLVIFGLLAAGLWGLREATPWRVAGFGVAVILATGLKFYPVVAAAALLVVDPVRLRRTALVATGLAGALVLWSQWEWFRRAVVPVSEGVYLFGAGVWWREFGLVGWSLPLLTALGLWVGAFLLVRRGWCHGLADAAEPLAPRAAFVAGATLLLACWLAGISFAYRWVFAVLLLPWLWRRRGPDARLTLVLLLIDLWLDGVFCLGTNLFIGPMDLGRLRAVQHAWQLGAQPLVWGLMLMLAAWGWDLLRVRWAGFEPWRAWARPAATRWLVIGLLLGWLFYVQSDRLREMLGLPNSGTWFLDSYAVLAASDAHRDGLDAAAAGHYDPLGRPHRYSDWWYALGSLGLTRDSNFLFGLGCVLAAAGGIVLTVRPRDWRSLLWALAVLLSPGVFLGFNRANNDLVVFALLGLGLAALRREGWVWHAVAAGAMALAAGLKFYPVVAGPVLAWHHLRGGRLRTALASAALVALALLAVWPQMVRGQFPVEATVHVWGARIWPQDLGLGTTATLGFLAIALMAGSMLAGWLGFRSMPVPQRPESETAFMLGVVVLGACFAAGANYGYRWIFAVWLGPWLLERLRDTGLPAPERRAAWLAWWLVPLVLWLDGLLCLLVNTGGLRVPGLSYAGLQLGWRLLTQPLHWLLFVLLGGALLGILRTPDRWLRTNGVPRRA